MYIDISLRDLGGIGFVNSFLISNIQFSKIEIHWIYIYIYLFIYYLLLFIIQYNNVLFTWLKDMALIIKQKFELLKLSIFNLQNIKENWEQTQVWIYWWSLSSNKSPYIYYLNKNGLSIIFTFNRKTHKLNSFI
jgi:hypothetical protein